MIKKPQNKSGLGNASEEKLRSGNFASAAAEQGMKKEFTFTVTDVPKKVLSAQELWGFFRVFFCLDKNVGGENGRKLKTGILRNPVKCSGKSGMLDLNQDLDVF